MRQRNERDKLWLISCIFFRHCCYGLVKSNDTDLHLLMQYSHNFLTMALILATCLHTNTEIEYICLSFVYLAFSVNIVQRVAKVCQSWIQETQILKKIFSSHFLFFFALPPFYKVIVLWLWLDNSLIFVLILAFRHHFSVLILVAIRKGVLQFWVTFHVYSGQLVALVQICMLFVAQIIPTTPADSCQVGMGGL